MNEKRESDRETESERERERANERESLLLFLKINLLVIY